MIRVDHPGSGSCFFAHPRSRIPDTGVKKAPDPGSGSATLAKKCCLLVLGLIFSAHSRLESDCRTMRLRYTGITLFNTRDADPHHLNADPNQAFHFNEDLDPAFQFFTDPDPKPDPDQYL